MQQMGYVHRDLKPPNIVVSKNKILRLIDFGSVYLSHI
jgi:serine/threonine protein kinase